MDDTGHDGGAGSPLPVSGKTLAGIDALRRAIRDRLGFSDFDPRRPMAFTDRQAELLRHAAHAARSGSPEDTKKNLRELLCA